MAKTIDVDTKTFVRFWLVILGFVAVGSFLALSWKGLTIIAFAIFLAIALSPLAKKIDQIDKRKSRKNLSSIVSVVLVVLGVVAVIGFVAPVVISETTKFASEIPGQMDKVLNSDTINEIGTRIGISDLKAQIIDAIRNASQSIIGNLSGFAVDSVSAIGNILTAGVLVIVLTIFFMLEGPSVMESFWKAIGKRTNGDTVGAYSKLTSRMAHVISKYVSGQITVALLDGLVTCLTVFILSIIFRFSAGLAIPMGLLAVVLYLIPMFGPIITCVVATLLIFMSSPIAAIVFLVFYIIYEQIENNAISPKIQGNGLDLPPLVILCSIVIGMYAFGLLGTIIAIPIAGCIKVLIEEYPELKKLHSGEQA